MVTGKVSGSVNNQQLDDLDLYAFVLTHVSDSRNFVAIGKIPPSLGGSFQVLISIVNPINWLFAGRNGLDESIQVANGFTLTGGLFSRVATLTFYDEAGRKASTVKVTQDFQGLDAQNKEVSVRTEIDGTLPNIDPDAQVVFRDYKQEYTRYGQGFIRSSGQIGYEITTLRNSQSLTPYKIDYVDEITYNECPHLKSAGSSVTTRVNSKRVFIRYTKGDNLVRFSSANFLYPGGNYFWNFSVFFKFKINLKLNKIFIFVRFARRSMRDEHVQHLRRMHCRLRFAKQLHVCVQSRLRRRRIQLLW